MTNEIIINLLAMENQMRIFHWQTMSHSEHKAFGKIYEKLSDLIDSFVEVCMAKHGRPDFGGEFTIPQFDYKSINVDQYINSMIEFFISLNNVYSEPLDSDILNIRDEMLAETNRLKYLLTLS
jgi:DNA-binding ferritin-like protein